MLYLIPVGRGVEICRHGFGSHPALRVHGRVHHRDVGRLCWEAHRAPHAVEVSTRGTKAERLTRALRDAFTSLSTCLHRRLESPKVCVSCDLLGSYLKIF